MMYAKDCWESLAKAAPGSRVVLRLADGTEVDLESITHYAGLVVVVPAAARAETVEDERDEAIARAEEAESERDEAIAKADRLERELTELLISMEPE